MDFEKAFIEVCIESRLPSGAEHVIEKKRDEIFQNARVSFGQLSSAEQSPDKLKEYFRDELNRALEILRDKGSYRSYVAYMRGRRHRSESVNKSGKKKYYSRDEFSNTGCEKKWLCVEKNGYLSGGYLRVVDLNYQLREVDRILPTGMVLVKGNEPVELDPSICHVINFDLAALVTQLSHEIFAARDLAGQLTSKKILIFVTKTLQNLVLSKNFTYERAILMIRQVVKQWLDGRENSELYKSYRAFLGDTNVKPRRVDDFAQRTYLMQDTQILSASGLKLGESIMISGLKVTVVHIDEDLDMIVTVEDEPAQYALSVEDFCELLEEEVYNNDPCNYRPTQSRMQ